MQVLSLFDGISCGRLALERAGIQVDCYFSSEIEKTSIQIAQKNFPDNLQIGDVTKIKKENGILFWENWSIGNIRFDILIGWSPCQTFSSGGNGTGFDWKSWLFYQFSRILFETKPKYFLLENVKMKKEWQDEISKILWVDPIAINSSLVSWQNRQRMYWIWKLNREWKYEKIDIQEPKDKNIEVSDILDTNESEIGKMKPCVKVNVENQIEKIRSSEKDIQVLDCTSGWQDNKVGIKKSPTLRAWNSFTLVRTKKWWVRLLTIAEKEKLQTLPVGYTEWIPDTKRHKAIGDGWTVDIIAHIFTSIFAIQKWETTDIL